MFDKPRTATADEMPVLDLSLAATPEGRQNLAVELRKAAVGLGFFYIRNHGTPDDQIDGVFAAADRYFALPLDQRLQCAVDPKTRRGYSPMFTGKVDEYGYDIKESFDFGFDLPADDPDVLAGKFLHGPNRWPEGLPWFREAIEQYLAELNRVSETLLRLFALSLGMSETFFLQYYNKPMLHTRLLHYPPHPPSSADDAFGIAPHEDIGFVTILSQDPRGGLEVRTRDGEWVGAPFIEGTYIVNLGALFKRWTNDIYVSSYHRVINRSGRERFSIATFLNLDYETPVSCVESCRVGTEPAHYPPVQSGAYLEGVLRRHEAKVEIADAPVGQALGA